MNAVIDKMVIVRLQQPQLPVIKITKSRRQRKLFRGGLNY